MEESVVRLFRSEDKYQECLRTLGAPFAERAIGAGMLLDAERLTPEMVPPEHVGGLQSRRLGYVTDPREWSFEMRKDAALLTLHLSQQALADGYEMKDASAFNVLFDRCRPVFIDHGSFRETYSGHWPGYSQFGDHFMNPLLVEANAGTPATSVGFGVEGVPLDVAAATNRGAGRLKRGSMSWIWRRALAERVSGRVGEGTGEQLADAALPPDTVDGMLRKASRRISALESAAPSIWRDYEVAACPYEDAQSEKKRALVSLWATNIDERHLALDVGCNVGTFAKILADHFDHVVAIDNDSVAIDLLYRRAINEGWGTKVTPAVVDLAQPTPAIGWMNRERASFLERLGVADLSVWLAVLHHIILAGGIPLPYILDLIAQVSRHAIIEHIAPEDQSVRSMTAGRRWASVPDVTEFRSLLDDRGFTTVQAEEISPTRTLVLVRCPS